MWFDVFVLAILLFTTVRGAQKGAVWQLAGIAGVVLCLVFAESISAAAGPYVHLDPPLNQWVVLFGSYLGFSFLAYSLAKMLNDSIEKAKFGEYNRHLGAVLGFVKGVAICLVITFFVVTVSDDARAALKDSRSGHAAAIIMDRLHPVMPEQLHDALDEYIHQLDSDDLDLRYADHDHTGHDHSEHDHEGQGGTPDGSLPPELEELVSRLPPDMQAEFRSTLLRSLNQTDSQDRGRLQNQLLEALQNLRTTDDVTSLWNTLQQPPDQLIGRLGDWLTTSNSGGTQPAGPTAEQQRQQLLSDIASVFSSFPQAQALIRQDIEQDLEQLPEQVALNVLEDWRADLWGTPDPDPATEMSTPLSERIVRQVARAGESGGELR
jgi:membrane protein required for colicin V production